MSVELARFVISKDPNAPDARGLSHAKLAEVLDEGVYPEAECREDQSTGSYSVWSGPMIRETPVKEVSSAPKDIAISAENMELLAALVASKIKAGA
jgi:hypothetical protein